MLNVLLNGCKVEGEIALLTQQVIIESPAQRVVSTYTWAIWCPGKFQSVVLKLMRSLCIFATCDILAP